MSSQSSKGRSGQRKNHRSAAKQQRQSGRVPTGGYNNSLVKRTFQIATTLTIPATTASTNGYVTWGSSISSIQEFREMSDVYAQCRLTGVRIFYAPQGFTSSSSPTYCSVVGAIAHDPTSNAFSGSPTYDDFFILPRAKLWASSGMGDMAWKSMIYRPQLSNVMNFSPEANESAAGQWIQTTDVTDMVGSTNFAAQTQDGAVHATINQQVLQVLCRFDVQFREPCPDRGAYQSHQRVMSRPSMGVTSNTPQLLSPIRRDYMVISQPVDDKDSKEGQLPERKEVPLAKPKLRR